MVGLKAAPPLKDRHADGWTAFFIFCRQQKKIEAAPLETLQSWLQCAAPRVHRDSLRQSDILAFTTGVDNL